MPIQERRTPPTALLLPLERPLGRRSRHSVRRAFSPTLSLESLLVIAMALLLGSSIACRDPEQAPTGKGLYLQHCAACHGESGDGNGPLAASLNRPPADLRRIAARNAGHFDESDVMATIDGRKNVAAHGPREMPVWGAVFTEENRAEHYPAYTSLLHSRALTDYLRSIQE